MITGAGGGRSAGGAGGGRWVATWTAAPQLTEPHNLPPPAFIADGVAFADCTLRQTVRVSVGGGRIRLRFSNAFASTDLVIARVHVALPSGGRAGVAAVVAGTARGVTFGGQPSVTVPAATQVVSDPLDFPLGAGATMTVTAYLPVGQPVSGGVTSHPGSRTTSYLAAGDSPERIHPTPVDHWYFLSGVEVWSSAAAGVAVALGDSLTDGRGSTTNGNDRWPDQLFARLRRGEVAVVNQGVGGDPVLRDDSGPGALARLDRDVLAVSGVRWLILFQGVNDIGTTEPTQAAQRQVARDLVFAYEQIVTRAHAAGIAVYGATLTPFGGNEPYDDPGGHRETVRQSVNAWIRGAPRPGDMSAPRPGAASAPRPGDMSAPRFDAVLDFDRAVRDPACPRRLRPALDTGDGLHLNPAGYAALAAAVPPGLFAPGTRGQLPEPAAEHPHVPEPAAEHRHNTRPGIRQSRDHA